ncbi:MAG: 1,4-dihydroxy-2-naphthoate polyprenyltransferase [Myxococcota bacterium]
MSAAPAMTSPGALTTWLMATRPRTLAASLVPVMVGTAAAAHDGAFRPPLAFAALLGAVLIQIGTNLVNDYADHLRGADNAERMGPPRVTQMGLLSPATVRAAAATCFAAALLVGLYLAMHGGWPIVVVGILSLLSGYAYTGGPWPLAYHGLGDVFVFVFFGPVAVVGTYYLQTGTVTALPVVASLGVGAVATALLVVNNLRDIPTDQKCGKRTLAVRLGERLTRVQYVFLLVVAVVTPLALLALLPDHRAILLGLLGVPFAVPPARVVLAQRGAALNGALAGTARLHVVMGALLSLGLML